MKKYKKRILLFIFILVIIFLSQFELYPRRDTFYVESSSIKNLNYLNSIQKLEGIDPTEYPAKVHELDRGSFVSFGYRFFKNPVPFLPNDEIYEKLTFSLDASLVKDQTVFTLPDSRLSVVYSSGASAWPETGCHGYPESGEIKIRKFENVYLINWKMIIKCLHFNRDSLDTVRVVYNGIFHKKKFEEMNAYLGAPTNNAYEATYPKK